MPEFTTSLMPDEEIVLRKRLHWTVFLRGACYALAGLLLFLLTRSGTGSVRLAEWSQGQSGAIGEIGGIFSQLLREADIAVFEVTGFPLGPVVGAGLFLYGAWEVFQSYLRYYATEFVVTTRRLAKTKGFYERNIDETMFSQLEVVNVRQGVRQRLFGYGLVVAVGTGGTPLLFDHIDSPMRVRQIIYRQMKSYRQKSQGATSSGAGNEAGARPGAPPSEDKPRGGSSPEEPGSVVGLGSMR